MIYLDTHVVLWLYEGTLDLFTRHGKQLLSDRNLIISPMVLLELQYLFEIKRSRVNASKIFDELQKTIGLSICSLPFSDIVQHANALHWTRDPFDRLIVGSAMIGGHPLMTKDRTIRQHLKTSVW